MARLPLLALALLALSGCAAPSDPDPQAPGLTIDPLLRADDAAQAVKLALERIG